MKHMIRTDGDVVEIARQIQALQFKAFALISDIEESDHPKAKEISDDLWDQCYFAAWPEHVISDHLDTRNSGRRMTSAFTIRRQRRRRKPDVVNATELPEGLEVCWSVKQQRQTATLDAIIHLQGYQYGRKYRTACGILTSSPAWVFDYEDGNINKIGCIRCRIAYVKFMLRQGINVVGLVRLSK